MYAKNKYNKFNHVVAAVVYAAILLTETGEFFVSNSHKIQLNHNSRVQHSREIPEHIPEKYESTVLKVLKICKQKTTYTKKGNYLVSTACLVVSILKGGSVWNPSEVNHKFIG